MVWWCLLEIAGHCCVCGPYPVLSVELGLDSWSHRHPCASSQLRVGFPVVVLVTCVLTCTSGVVYGITI